MFSPASFNQFRPSRSTPPAADGVTDVPLYIFEAAQSVNATHLSKDGLTAYDERNYGTWYCTWNEKAKKFSSWWPIGDLPADAVKM